MFYFVKKQIILVRSDFEFHCSLLNRGLRKRHSDAGLYDQANVRTHKANRDRSALRNNSRPKTAGE